MLQPDIFVQYVTVQDGLISIKITTDTAPNINTCSTSNLNIITRVYPLIAKANLLILKHLSHLAGCQGTH